MFSDFIDSRDHLGRAYKEAISGKMMHVVCDMEELEVLSLPFLKLGSEAEAEVVMALLSKLSPFDQAIILDI